MSLVLFDIDGTLLRNAGPHHKNALVEGVRRVTGLTATLEGVATQGMLDCDLILGMLDNARWGDSLPQIFEECQNAYLANCADTLEHRVCPGVRETLTRLQEAGAVMGLVTGNLSAIGWKKMELAGLKQFFSLGAFSEQAGSRAELAALALKSAIARGLVTHGEKTSLVGDHPNDVNAARLNGFQSIAVATGISTHADLAEARPDILVATLAELELSQFM